MPGVWFAFDYKIAPLWSLCKKHTFSWRWLLTPSLSSFPAGSALHRQPEGSGQAGRAQGRAAAVATPRQCCWLLCSSRWLRCTQWSMLRSHFEMLCDGLGPPAASWGGEEPRCFASQMDTLFFNLQAVQTGLWTSSLVQTLLPLWLLPSRTALLRRHSCLPAAQIPCRLRGAGGPLEGDGNDSQCL